MSLQVWLPLNGDINNYGLSDLTFTQTNDISSNASGKIGSCYYSPNNYTPYLTSNKTLTLGNKQSMFCWVKVSQFYSVASLTGVLGQHRYQTCTGMGITLKYSSASTGYLSINTGNGSGRTFNEYCGSTQLQADTWYHVGFTYDGTYARLYVNGNLDGIHNVGTLSNPADYVQIFAWSFANYAVSNDVYADYHLNGYLNDVRIYDHVLSTAEIKEISQALVLHYPLRDGEIEPTTNYSDNHWVSYDSYYTIQSQTNTSIVVKRTSTSTTSQVALYTMNVLNNMSPGEVWTLSCYLYKNGVPWKTSATRASAYLTSVISYEARDDGYFTVTFNVPSDDYQWVIHEALFGGTTTDDICEFRYLQLEKKDHATPFVIGSRTGLVAEDCSGYNRNGIVTASTCPVPVSGSARNGICYQFDGNDDYIVSSVKQSEVLADGKFTISAWVYPTEHRTCRGVFGPHEWNTEAQGICFCQAESGGFGFSFGTGSSWSSEFVDTNYTLNTWTHYAMSYNNLDSKAIIYKNGSKIGETSGSFHPAATNNIWVGRTYPDSIRYWKGKLSDVRLYATPLSADDIARLYKTSASIDKNKKLHCYELVEE